MTTDPTHLKIKLPHFERNSFPRKDLSDTTMRHFGPGCPLLFMSNRTASLLISWCCTSNTSDTANVAANSGFDTDLKIKFKWMSSKSAKRSEICWKQIFSLQFRYIDDSTERAEFSERVSSFIERRCNPEEKPAQLPRAEAPADPIPFEFIRSSSSVFHDSQLLRRGLKQITTWSVLGEHSFEPICKLARE